MTSFAFYMLFKSTEIVSGVKHGDFIHIFCQGLYSIGSRNRFIFVPIFLLPCIINVIPRKISHCSVQFMHVSDNAYDQIYRLPQSIEIPHSVMKKYYNNDLAYFVHFRCEESVIGKDVYMEIVMDGIII